MAAPVARRQDALCALGERAERRLDRSTPAGLASNDREESLANERAAQCEILVRPSRYRFYAEFPCLDHEADAFRGGGGKFERFPIERQHDPPPSVHQFMR